MRSVIWKHWIRLRLYRRSLNISKAAFYDDWDRTGADLWNLASSVSHGYLIAESRASRRVFLMKKAIATSLAADCMTYLEKMAAEAAACNRFNDSKGAYRIVKMLAGLRSQPLLALLDSAGNFSVTRDDIDRVCVEHLSKVSNASVCPLKDLQLGDPQTIGRIPAIVFTEDRVSLQIRELANGRGMGLDANEAEVIKAASPTSDRVMTTILNDVGKYHYAPISMIGGLLSELYKSKGDTQITDNYRGLLLSDHHTKILTGTLQTAIEEPYYTFLHEEQYGAAKKRSADFASHTTSSFLQFCQISSLSCFILFADLSKAFDFAIRETLMSF